MNEKEFRTGEKETKPETAQEFADRTADSIGNTETVNDSSDAQSVSNPDETPKTDSNLGIDLTGKPTSELISALEKAADALQLRHEQLQEGDAEREQIARFKAQLASLAEYFLEKLTAPSEEETQEAA